ncbi:hypothetical protein [Actinacidiphila guanduensis]|uniref:Uncharacterized protein n=1 Tax=Actinacidiphila guanduensis TaxID=310781 RepID=A0A1H0S0Y2_9ACTN|nr:hypothetical protein [Actinacidiphila guanduensis]SDP35354.1 hypothetical protein SAMN05216259_1258 [Actinacidiphila guanduensis]
MSSPIPPALAELTEIKAYVEQVTEVPVPVREAMGVAWTRFGSVLALAVRQDTTQFYNRAGGFGATAPITAEQVGRSVSSSATRVSERRDSPSPRRCARRSGRRSWSMNVSPKAPAG